MQKLGQLPKYFGSDSKNLLCIDQIKNGEKTGKMESLK